MAAGGRGQGHILALALRTPFTEPKRGKQAFVSARPRISAAGGKMITDSVSIAAATACAVRLRKASDDAGQSVDVELRLLVAA